jgi:hypothetical protein
VLCSSGRTSIVISVKLGWSSGSSFFGAAAADGGAVVLQAPHLDWSANRRTQAFLARDQAFGDRP